MQISETPFIHSEGSLIDPSGFSSQPPHAGGEGREFLEMEDICLGVTMYLST